MAVHDAYHPRAHALVVLIMAKQAPLSARKTTLFPKPTPVRAVLQNQQAQIAFTGAGTDGQVATRDSTVSAGFSWQDPGAIWTTVTKTSTQTRTFSTSFDTDSALRFTATSGTTYRVRLNVFFASTAAADFQCGFNGPAMSFFAASGVYMPAGSSGGSGFGGFMWTGVGSALAITAGTSGDGWVTADAIFTPSASGTFGFAWAQQTADVSSTSVYKGSYLEYRAL